MNDDQKKRLFELFTAHAADSLTPDEHAELQETLRRDAGARRLWFVHQDIEMGLHAHLATEPVMPAKAVVVTPHPSVWCQWRPLTAAAAGIDFGILCTSVVFGFVVQRGVEKRTPVAVFEPSFENARMPLANGFPGGLGQWSGEAAHVVTAENGVTPKEGKFMLGMEPMSKGVPRIYQVLDLQSLPPGAGGESREIEISASFAAADAEASVRYVIRAFAGTEAPESLDAGWFGRREEAIASATRGLDVMPGTKGWQTFNVKIQVPRAARSLVLFFGVRTPDKAARTSPNYLDDVRLSLLTPAALL